MLGLAWVLVFVLPPMYFEIPISLIVKIVAIVATLEMLSFITFNLFGRNKSLLIQGFIGGLASSTTVFVQSTRDERFRKLSPYHLAAMLMLAIVAMLVESFVIGLGLNAPTIVLVVIVMQIIIMLAFAGLTWKRRPKNFFTDTNQFVISHPILWLRVLKLTFFIAALIALMEFGKFYFKDAYFITIFVTSLFEAHAVLAATLLDSNQHIVLAYAIITFGHSLSKLILVWRANFPGLVKLILIPLLCSLVVSLIATVF